MNTYFISDTHFWHKHILSFEKRPYDTLEEMNEQMIARWNEQVTDEDIVYHLGDLSLGTLEQAIELLQKLNGKIILIKGNHDFSKHYKKINELGLLHGYHEVGTIIKYKKNQCWLSHYPMEIGLRPNLWSIHGHIHSEESSFVNQINVGVDSPHFSHLPFGTLISIEELFQAMEKRAPIIETHYLDEKKKRKNKSFTEWYEYHTGKPWHNDYAELGDYAEEMTHAYEAYCLEHHLKPIWNG